MTFSVRERVSPLPTGEHVFLLTSSWADGCEEGFVVTHLLLLLLLRSQLQFPFGEECARREEQPSGLCTHILLSPNIRSGQRDI